MTMATTIEQAHEEDLGDVLALLERHGLPVDDANRMDALVARVDGRVVGAAGLELYADGALLRSVVVDAGMQGQGLGQQLTEAAVALARGHRMPAVFLLTTTADGFFPRFGFEAISRVEVPESVQRSVEFRSACPASAIVMRKHLR